MRLHATTRVLTTVVLTAVMVAFPACTTETDDGLPLDAFAAARTPGWHGLLVSVLDPAGQPAGGVLVTATNVATGEYVMALTGPKGKADFDLAPGGYLVHARNLGDAGPILSPFPKPLVTAPLPPEARLIATGATQGLNQLGVLYDAQAPNTSVPLDPLNYSRLTASPALVLAGPSSDVQLSLRFLTGANLDCTFFDANGSPVALPLTRNVYVILPHANGPLPPLPSFATGLNLPRGILLGVTTAPANATSCALGGFPLGSGYTAVIESTQFDVGDQANLLLGSLEPDGDPDPMVRMTSEPRRSGIGYLIDPLGDASGKQDIGLTSFGWRMTGNTVSDDFVADARFVGEGDYMLELTWSAPAPGQVFIRAHCNQTGCVRHAVEPASMLGATSVTGATFVDAEIVSGTVQYTVKLPGVTHVQFRILASRPPRSDLAPDVGFRPAAKTGTGNTWLIPGD